MATHSSILAWKISWAEEPGELQSMGLQGVRHGLVIKKKKKILCMSVMIIKWDSMCTTQYSAKHNIGHK